MIGGFGLLLGMIIGAGTFALPYGFEKAGIGRSLALFGLVFLISWILHLLYAAIIYSTPGRHRFPGYVGRFLGVKAERAALVFTFFGSWGAMLAYGVLGGVFLHTAFGISAFMGGLVFFMAGGFLFFLPLKSVGRANFYLTLPLLIFILVLAWELAPAVNVENFASSGSSDWFLLYGILLFAFGGYSALPDLHDVLGANSRALSKKIIFASLFIAAVFYLVFIFAIWGASGPNATPDAFLGLGKAAGRGIIMVGSLIGILAVFTSYVVFGADLKLTFRYDYRIPETFSWLLAFLPPVFLFWLGFTDLVKILSLVGSVGLGVFAVFVLLISWKKRGELSSFLGFTPRLWWLLPLGILVVLGAAQNIFLFYVG